ncbi:type 1 glutamine amidotransferase domain-containing protein [Lacticaseibacillus sp. GG6-2]
MSRALIVVTNHARFDGRNRATGLWLSEATHFHDVMSQNGIAVDYVSPAGGFVPLDPGSLAEGQMDALNWSYYGDSSYRQKYLANSLAPNQVDPAAYDLIYFAGGHGVMWDFPHNAALGTLALTIYQQGGIVSAVCHGVVGLLTMSDFIKDKHLTGFTNEEERLNQLTDAVPFLTEDALKKAGADFSEAKAYTEHVIIDKRLITGQNPQSAHQVGVEAVRLLQGA